jgi:hypothetical protein
MGLPLWLLEQTEKHWEQCHAQAVAATDEHAARHMAAGNAYGEGPGVWTDPTATTCVQVAASSIYEEPTTLLTKEAS